MFRRALLLLLVGCGSPCAVRWQKCESIACPAGADFAASQCRCRNGSVVLGACMSPRDAADLCGPASRPIAGGCANIACGKNETLDRATGVCLPQMSLRAVAEAMQIPLLEKETIGCMREGDALVLSGTQAACVDKSAACGPGARFVDPSRACAPERACAAGEVTTVRGECARVVFAGEKGPLIDVAEWSRHVLGPDGGFGSSFLCGPLATRPWAFTGVTDAHLTLLIAVDLSFPDNDVSQTQVRIHAYDGLSGQLAVGVETIDSVVRRLTSSLRALGGTARAATASTHVRCVLPLGPRPIALPVSAGDSTR